ncbi:MAG: hypothetical protein ACR2J8_10085 [Thermomicrobiales bacterium]
MQESTLIIPRGFCGFHRGGMLLFRLAQEVAGAAYILIDDDVEALVKCEASPEVTFALRGPITRVSEPGTHVVASLIETERPKRV